MSWIIFGRVGRITIHFTNNFMVFGIKCEMLIVKRVPKQINNAILTSASKTQIRFRDPSLMTEKL